MRGKGASQVRRWKGALAKNGEDDTEREAIADVAEIAYRSKKDHAEGITPWHGKAVASGCW
jgi:hypothetical protein